MALFKIHKGAEKNSDGTSRLPSSYVEGYAYFATDTGRFYIDTTSAESGRKMINPDAVVNISRSGKTFTMTKADGSTAQFTQQDNNTNYYHNPLFTSGVEIGSGTGGLNADLYVPEASGTQKGVTIVYPANQCTTFTSDTGTVTPAAVKKAVETFAVLNTGDNVSGSLTFSNPNASTQKDHPYLIWNAIGANTPKIGYATDQTDGTFIVASIKGTSYTDGLAIGGGSGNLLWKGKRVLTVDDAYTLPAATSSALGGVKIGSNITVSSGTISLTKDNITTALGYTPPTTNTTYSNFVKSGSGAKAGLVPAPSTTAGTTKYLREDGTWAVPPDTNTVYTLPTASSSTLGGVKTTSTVTSTSGLTACPIISGVPYYRDTNNTYSLSSFGITATAAELNVLDGITATTAELNYCDGVTSNIQTQLNNKAASSHTHYYAGSDSIGGRAHQAQALTNGSQSYASCYYDTSNSSTILQMSNSSGPQYAFECRAGTTDLYIHHYNTNGSWNSGWRIWRAGDSVTGAVWNDYAEYRESNCEEPGRVLIENGDDTLSATTERLQHFAGISSDTWGFCQGETEKAKTPIAVAGRVLAYTYRDRNEYKPGDCVCAAPNGTVDIMTREEIMMYPDRIVGTVSCVPEYEEWGQGDRPAVKVDGRIWVKVK